MTGDDLHRPLRRVVLVAVSLGVCLSLGGGLFDSDATAAPRYRACTGGFDLDGTGGPSGFYRGITQRETNCVQARAVAHGYVAQLHGVAGSLDRRPVRVGAYVCTTRVTTDADRITCSASRGRRVKFFGAS